jgi:TRAP-type C4-dicarboxylate transport system substrate-binding protein
MKTEFVETDKMLYVLNIYAQADMTNGFRYIKELLMQHFNQRMQDSLDKLRANGMQILPPSPQLKADMAKVGEVLLKEWLEKAGPEGKALVDAYRK